MTAKLRLSVRMALALVALCVIPALLARMVFEAKAAANRARCINNLRQIGEALQNYHSTYECFPPAYIADASGKPIHSWRVLILPFIESSPFYYHYNLSQPWDSPSNLKVINGRLNYFYVCPNHREPPSPFTSYVALVGPGSTFPGSGSSRLKDAPNGPARSIMIVETANTEIGWAEPRDLDITKLDWVINGSKGPGISSEDGTGAHVLFMDGTVSFIREDVSPKELKAMATLSGGEPATAR